MVESAFVYHFADEGVRAIGRDPALYHNPDVFDPDRFLGKNAEMDSRKVVFGFGRRICAGKPVSLSNVLHFTYLRTIIGMPLAERSLFLNISRMLASFNFLRPLGEDGREVDVTAEWIPGVTR